MKDLFWFNCYKLTRITDGNARLIIFVIFSHFFCRICCLLAFKVYFTLFCFELCFEYGHLWPICFSLIFPLGF